MTMLHFVLRAHSATPRGWFDTFPHVHHMDSMRVMSEEHMHCAVGHTTGQGLGHFQATKQKDDAYGTLDSPGKVIRGWKCQEHGPRGRSRNNTWRASGRLQTPTMSKEPSNQVAEAC
jgi:hypothetical protein